MALLTGLLATATAAVPTGAQSAGDRAEVVIPGTDVAFAIAYIPGGEAWLGSAAAEPGRQEDEGPRRRIRLSPFWIGVHEVTHEEFSIYRRRALDTPVTSDEAREFDVDAVTRPSPPYEDPAHGLGGARKPATGMTWWAALQYARWLSEKTGRLFRLPTEAEWEHVCLADSPEPAPLDERAWHAGNGDESPHDVGELEPNAWGVHDLLGNVAEWTMDFYDAGFYESLPPDAEDPWSRSDREHPHTVRGGSFESPPEALRCADRIPSTLEWKRRDPQLPQSRWWNTDSPHVGFRLVSPAERMTLAEIRAYWADLLGS